MLPNSNINWKRVTFNNHLNIATPANINRYFSGFSLPKIPQIFASHRKFYLMPFPQHLYGVVK